MRDAIIVDAEMWWVGDFIVAKVRLRNPLPRTIRIEAARVRRPFKCLISSSFEHDEYGQANLGKPKAGTHRSAALDYEIYPSGSTSAAPLGSSGLAADAIRLELAIFPSFSWNGGKIALELVFSENASIRRHSRTTVQRRIPPRPNNKSDDIISRSA